MCYLKQNCTRIIFIAFSLPFWKVHVCKYSWCLSIIICVHFCYCLELIVHTNAGITVKCLLSDVWYFTFFQSIFSWGEITGVWEPLFELSTFTAVDKVKDRILYNKVWKDNWTYWDTCQYDIIYCSIGTIWVHFKRNYNLFDQVLINITFVSFSLYLNRS
jgi:hypothetical protein